MKAIRIQQNGGPEVLKLEEVPTPQPGPGQALVKLEAIGVNFIDVYHRTGLYKTALPLTPGQEGSGTITALGEGAAGVKVGDRVAWTSVMGSYAEYQVVPADRLIKLPKGLEAKDGAAAMLQGMTAHYLATTTFQIGRASCRERV